MKRIDFNFQEYQTAFNKQARRILKESYNDFDAEDVSNKIDEAAVTYQKI